MAGTLVSTLESCVSRRFMSLRISSARAGFRNETQSARRIGGRDRKNKEMAPWLRQSRAAGHPMRSLRPFSRRVPGRPGAVQRYPNLDEISLSSVCSTTKLAPRVGMGATCKRLIGRCLHGPLLQVPPNPAATVQPCDELEEVLKIAA